MGVYLDAIAVPGAVRSLGRLTGEWPCWSPIGTQHLNSCLPDGVGGRVYPSLTPHRRWLDYFDGGLVAQTEAQYIRDFARRGNLRGSFGQPEKGLAESGKVLREG